VRAFLLDGDKVRETKDIAEVRAAVAAKRTIWIDLEAQTPETDALLADTFALHPLTIEDVWTDGPSPKADEFPGYLYVCAHTVKREGTELVLRELDLIVGAHFVVTHDTGGTTAALRDELLRSPRVLARGAAWVAHGVLDRLVDAYLPIIDGFDDDISALETDVLAKAGTPGGAAVLGTILSLKGAFQALRRVAIHQRELLLRLSRGEFAAFPPDVLPYLRDVHDHFVRVGDLADSYRDLVTSALDAYLSVQSNRMNEVMKTLTLISTVMLPLTFIAGLYGMNFQHMPELRWEYGYPFALVLMAVVAASAFVWFRYKRWIG
jgi:magnesium transporter